MKDTADSPEKKVLKFASPREMAEAAAELVLDRALAAVHERGLFSLVLAGGGTPLPLYQRLAAEPYLARMPWPQTHLFWGDERCLPPRHPESNFGRAAAILLAPGQVPAANIHRMPGELPPAEGAAVYRRELAELGRDFDLVLLGMGEDGHVASLFPGSPLLAEEEAPVAAVTEPTGQPPVTRLTLTLPAINRAATVLIMVSGPTKAAIVEEINQDRQAAAHRYPAALVQARSELLWLVSA